MLHCISVDYIVFYGLLCIVLWRRVLHGFVYFAGSRIASHFNVLYGIVLYHSVLYCDVLSRKVRSPSCIVMYSRVFSRSALYPWIVRWCVIVYCIVPVCIVLYHIVPYYLYVIYFAIVLYPMCCMIYYCIVSF